MGTFIHYLNFKIMKKLKIGFLAIVALAAMSFTVITRPEVKKKFAPKDVYTCTSSDYSQVTFTTSSGTVTAPQSPLVCGKTYCATSLRNITPSGEITCDGADEIFCCISSSTSTDCSAPFTTKLIVHCRPNN